MVSSYIFCTILIIKRFVIYYESFIVIVDSVLYLIKRFVIYYESFIVITDVGALPYSFYLSGNAIGTHLLRDYLSHHYQILP